MINALTIYAQLYFTSFYSFKIMENRIVSNILHSLNSIYLNNSISRHNTNFFTWASFDRLNNYYGVFYNTELNSYTIKIALQTLILTFNLISSKINRMWVKVFK